MKTIEQVVNEALQSYRLFENEENELTPEQLAVIKSLAKLSENIEGDDDAKFEKLKTTLDKLPKAMLTAAFVATLITSLASCRTSGYGCKGRESWKSMERRINRPY
jgi:hypothetical protein